jgi:hypothetical protein
MAAIVHNYVVYMYLHCLFATHPDEELLPPVTNQLSHFKYSLFPLNKLDFVEFSIKGGVPNVGNANELGTDNISDKIYSLFITFILD